MTTTKALYSGSGSGTSIAVTSAATLANGSAAGCAAVDNTSGLYLDAHVFLTIGIASGSLASDKVINVWLSGSEDGTHYRGTTGASLDNYAGTDAAVTLQNPTLFAGPVQLPVPNANLTIYYDFWYRDYYGGLVLPKKWGFVIENRTGLAFTSCAAEFTGINLQSV